MQLSAFADTSPRGFGLVQRQRGFTAYEDVGARYDLRPAAWVEPAEEWGAGAVHLAELPTGTEFQDNIVAFWRPEGALRAGTSRRFAYRLRWCDEVADQARPEASNPLARVVAFRSGASTDPASRFFMLDIAGGDLRPGEAALDAAAPPASPEARAAMLIPEVSCSAGRIKWAEIKPVPAYTVPPARLRSASHPRSEAQLHGRTALYRVGFELTPGDASAVDLTVRVKRGGRTVSETWMYRWTAPKAAPKP